MELLVSGILFAIPLAALAFAISALWQILKAMGSMQAELTRIRELLERERPS